MSESPVGSNLPAFVEESAAKAALKLGFTQGLFTVSFEAGSNCDGLVGEIHQATITEGERCEVLFCKIPPLDPARREQFNSMKLFEREVLLYSSLLPKLFDFQIEKGVTEGEGFFNVPKCYQTHFDAVTEESLILMENLRNRDLRMWNKVEPIDYNHARLLMFNLGRFHSLSFALKDQRPDLFEQFKLLDELLPTIKASKPLLDMFRAAMGNAISVLDPEEVTARSKMEVLKRDYVSTFEDCLDGARAEPYAVLNHGDCWVNNFMYEYKDGAPSEMTLIDWQLARYVSPALDIAYFLFCCTDEAFREKYFDEMLQVYHSSLTNLLNRLGSDAAKLFPFTALTNQMKTFAKFAVIMGAFDIPILCTDPADMPELDGDLVDAFAASPGAQQRYGSRMGGVIRDAIKYGYL